MEKARKSYSPISSDVLKDVELYQKKFPGDINVEGFNKTAVKSSLANKSDIQVKLKTENGSVKKNYKIINDLGEGGFGMTYLALDKDEMKLCVIKFQSKRNSKKEIDCLKAVKEICGELILCYIGHFDYNIGLNVFSGIVTDYQENLVTLDEYLIKRQKDKKQNLTLDEKDDILKNVQIAADKLSNQGIIHNDLHFGNLLWNIGDGPKKGTIKIIDFGLCKFEPNILYAKFKNDESIDKLSKSLNMFLSPVDQKKVEAQKLDSFERRLKALKSPRSSPRLKEKAEENSFDRRLREMDSLDRRLKALNFNKRENSKDEVVFDFGGFPSVPKTKPGQEEVVFDFGGFPSVPKTKPGQEEIVFDFPSVPKRKPGQSR
jgi:tRNA A-37 threonylcarbamoyl transferase component Bud32